MTNIDLSHTRTIVPIDEIKSLYDSGFSVKKLAEHFGCSRGVIANRLIKLGIVQRNRSESMYLRMSQTSHEDRVKLVKGANNGMRKTSKEQRIKRLSLAAIGKQQSLSEVGIFEDIFFNALKEFNPVMQLAVGTYNIDIACGTVAVEIHNSTTTPHKRTGLLQRIEYLLKCGYTVVYFKIREKGIVNKIAIDKAIRICNHARINPSLSCKYWVISGTGETLFVGQMNGDNISIVATPKDFFDI